MRRHPRRTAVIVAVTALTLLIAGLFGLIRDRGDETARPPAAAPGTPMPSLKPRPSGASGQARPSPGALTDNIAALEQQPVVAPAPDTARISGETATQPDLYVAEFVRRLLTQRYDQPRAAHLAWVQAESAPTTDPLVVGLVPERLRDRLAVHSVTTGYPTDAPVPDASSWAELGRRKAFTTVSIDRVEEPTAWVNAVRGGRIHDPGVTGRAVAATITRHQGGTTQSTSVLVLLNLEGPPTRPEWGCVTIVDYVAIPMRAGS